MVFLMRSDTDQGFFLDGSDPVHLDRIQISAKGYPKPYHDKKPTQMIYEFMAGEEGL